MEWSVVARGIIWTLAPWNFVKAIFSEGFTETLCTGVYFQWMDSLKMQEQYSIFSEGFTETMGTEIYFQWMIHWNIGHWNLFSVNSFAENKVKIVVLYILPECKWGAQLPALGHSACRWIYGRSCDARLMQSQTYGYLASAEHCHCPLTSSYFHSQWGRRLSQPSIWLHTEVAYR